MKQPGETYRKNRKTGIWNLESGDGTEIHRRKEEYGNLETDNGKKRQTQRFTISFCLNLTSESYH